MAGGILIKALLFFEDIKKDGVVVFKRNKHYLYERDDHDYFYIRTEAGIVDTVHKLSCNILYMVVEENYAEENY